MKILAIETSCDETGVCVLEHTSGTQVMLLGNALASQIDLHAQYGGVFPTLAKRAHTEKILPLLSEALGQAGLLKKEGSGIGTDKRDAIAAICTKDVVLADLLETFLNEHARPAVDYIAVTAGPGLEPALWVGVNTARVLASVWNIPLIAINHMEGHVVTAAFAKSECDFVGLAETQQTRFSLTHLQFPALSLLVSGGHTELVVADAFGSYTKIGKTRDDAVGEAFDKVARILGVPYPGGPAVSKLAAQFRESGNAQPFSLPRPMLHSKDFDFSFSGIKTAVLYAVRDLLAQTGKEALSEFEKMALAGEFETAAIEVLVKKTIAAAQENNAATIIVGGGVAGNSYLRSQLSETVQRELPAVTLLFPEPWLATDNAIMIGMAAMTQYLSGKIKTRNPEELRADGNLSL